MSDLLNSASLVMIPSGYKEDIVYSAVPTDGSGDLSFTRASNGTRINSAGLVEVVPWNFILQSQSFNVGSWGYTNYTLSANSTTAPDGTLTADLFTLNNGIVAGAGSAIDQGLSQLGQITLSVYFKNNNSTGKYVIQDGNGRGIEINVVTLAFTNLSSAVGSVESVGNGWYRIVTTITQTSSYYFYSYQDGMTGDGSKGIYLWGAQLNIGSTAKPYFPTTDRLNVPRLTYQNGGGGCPSLLLEKQSTNYAQYSEDFSNGFWTKDTTTTITANDAISPDGTQNADRFESPSPSKGIYSYGVSGSQTISVYIKAGNSGNVGKSATLFTTLATQDFILTNDWQRISVSGAASSLWALYPTATNSFTNVLIWGGQAENSSYPTSYIPTTSASATRVADAMSVNLSNTNMTFCAYLELDEAPLGTTAGDWLAIYNSASAFGRAYGYSNQFGFADAYSLGVVSGTKMIWKQESGTTAKVFKGGALVGTSTTGTYSNPFNTLTIYGANLDKPLRIKEFVFFDNNLTDAECIALTT